jgi:type IV secretory pathway VirJ component
VTARVLSVFAAAAITLGVASSSSAAQSRTTSVRADDDVTGLPLHVVAAKTSPPAILAVLLSGDGGWAGIDKRIADDFSSHGIGVVGLDSRSYLMKPRTPEEASADVARAIRHYTQQWSVQRVTVVGYSRGADMAPFVVNRLTPPLREEVALVALLAPAERANFQFHWADLLTDTSRPSDRPILPELERLRGTPVLCVYGKDEKESLCRFADTSAVQVDKRRGQHHFDGDYDAIANEIMRALAQVDASGK